MQKFKYTTVKSEDERAKLSCYANSSSQLHIFASSPTKVRVTPSGHHKHLKPGRLLHPKSKCYEELYLGHYGTMFIPKTSWRGAKKFVCFYLVYIQIY